MKEIARRGRKIIWVNVPMALTAILLSFVSLLESVMFLMRGRKRKGIGLAFSGGQPEKRGKKRTAETVGSAVLVAVRGLSDAAPTKEKKKERY